MKINRLSITGFGPYRTTQTIDFDAYADDGLFLISGKTGAGKSSILDAIAFALYDSVPRYDGTKSRLRSDHCAPGDETRVELEFTIGTKQYRVARSPEYDVPKKRGSGMTAQKAAAQLDVREGDAWVGIASRPVDVAHELAAVVGLKKEQFLQVILLAQNRFQQFLLANSRDREAVLRSLFGTARFAAYEEAVTERRRELEKQLAASRAQLDQIVSDAAQLADDEAPDDGFIAWLEQQVLALGERLAVAISEATAADTARDAAESRHAEASELLRRQRRLAEANAQAAELDRIEDTIADLRTRVAAAEVAEQVWPYVEAKRSASSAAVAARAHADETARALHDIGGDATATPDELDAVAEEQSGRLAVLETVRADEARLDGLAKTERVAAEKKQSIEAALAEHENRVSALPEEISAAREALTAARIEASRGEAAAADVERLVTARVAAERSAAIEVERDTARRAEADSVRANTEGSTALQRLLDERLSGHAAELASELKDGEPCAVCGATQHPSPAVHTGTPVTEADVEAARATLSERERAKADAARAVSELEAKLAEHRAIAGERTAAQIDAELEPARERHAAAQSAESRADELSARHDALVAERDAGDAERERLGVERDAQAAAEKEARVEIERITQKVDEQRGEAASISDVVREATALREASATYASALRTRDDRDASATQAADALTESLASHELTDEAAVDDARLSAADREQMRASIRTHDDARASVRSILAEPELADLPDTEPDVEASAQAVESARTARDESTQNRDRIADRHAQLVKKVTEAKRRVADSAAAHAEFEVVENLAETLAGDGPNTRKMRLEGFVLAAELERIVDAANARLRTMTGGRYTLEHDDTVQYRNVKSGLGLSIFDQHTGVARATHSLSGGETFLASLALALGLAEVVTARAGGITLDTLFIDEGFGSLDAETLEVAMSTLDSLRAGGRTVGLISHVEGMKEQIPAKLRITVADGGWSQIHQDV